MIASFVNVSKNIQNGAHRQRTLCCLMPSELATHECGKLRSTVLLIITWKCHKHTSSFYSFLFCSLWGVHTFVKSNEKFNKLKKRKFTICKKHCWNIFKCAGDIALLSERSAFFGTHPHFIPKCPFFIRCIDIEN